MPSNGGFYHHTNGGQPNETWLFASDEPQPQIGKPYKRVRTVTGRHGRVRQYETSPGKSFCHMFDHPVLDAPDAEILLTVEVGEGSIDICSICLRRIAEDLDERNRKALDATPSAPPGDVAEATLAATRTRPGGR